MRSVGANVCKDIFDVVVNLLLCSLGNVFSFYCHVLYVGET